MMKAPLTFRFMSLFAAAVLASASALAAGPTFAVTMKLTGANLGTSINADTLEVGMSGTSTDAVDPNNVDIPVPPGSPQAAVTVQFTSAGLPPDISGLITDMRLQETSKTWALVVAGMPSSGSPTIIIDWNTSGIYGFHPSVAALAGYNLLFKGNGADVDMKAVLTTTITRNGTYFIALTEGANTNSAPVAISDSTSTLKGTAKIINVLANDSDPDGNVLNVSLVSAKPPTHGIAVVNVDKTITYTPTGADTGTDSFDYMITDVPAVANFAKTATATVTVDINNKFVITRSFPARSTKPGSTFTVNLLVAYGSSPTGLKIEEDLPILAETETAWTQTGAITFKDNAGGAYVPAGLTVTPVQVGNVITFTYGGTFPTSNPFTMVYQVTIPGDATSSNNYRTFTGHFAEDPAPAAAFDGEIPATNMTVRNATLDVTGDGKVDNFDAVYIYRYINGKRAASNSGNPGGSNLRPSSQFSLAGAGSLVAIEDAIVALGSTLNVTGDATTDNFDAVYIYRYINGKRAASNNGNPGGSNLRPSLTFSLSGAATIQVIEDNCKAIDLTP